MTVTIWHNPRCSKSRQTLELLHRKGVTPTIRDYLKQPPSKADVFTGRYFPICSRAYRITSPAAMS